MFSSIKSLFTGQSSSTNNVQAQSSNPTSQSVTSVGNNPSPPTTIPQTRNVPAASSSKPSTSVPSSSPSPASTSILASLSRPFNIEPTIPFQIPSITTIKTSLGDDFNIHESKWKDNIDVSAGNGLLKRYEKMWDLLHRNNVDLARHSDVADRKLHQSVEVANKIFMDLRSLSIQTDSLKATEAKMAMLKKNVQEVTVHITALELKLVELEKARLERAQEIWKKEASDQTLAYEQEKLKELKKINNYSRIMKERADREKLVREKMIELEAKRQKETERKKKQEERRRKRDMYDKMIKEGMEKFKVQYGTVSMEIPPAQKQPLQSSTGSVTEPASATSPAIVEHQQMLDEQKRLEEMVMELDREEQNDLEEFLNDRVSERSTEVMMENEEEEVQLVALPLANWINKIGDVVETVSKGNIGDESEKDYESDGSDHDFIEEKGVVKEVLEKLLPI